jgi:hypothetical protein
MSASALEFAVPLPPRSKLNEARCGTMLFLIAFSLSFSAFSLSFFSFFDCFNVSRRDGAFSGSELLLVLGLA